MDKRLLEAIKPDGAQSSPSGVSVRPFLAVSSNINLMKGGKQLTFDTLRYLRFYTFSGFACTIAFRQQRLLSNLRWILYNQLKPRCCEHIYCIPSSDHHLAEPIFSRPSIVFVPAPALSLHQLHRFICHLRLNRSLRYPSKPRARALSHSIKTIVVLKLSKKLLPTLQLLYEA